MHGYKGIATGIAVVLILPTGFGTAAASEQAAVATNESAREDPPADVEIVRVFDERPDSALLGMRLPLPPEPVDTELPPSRWQMILVERDSDGSLERLAEGVGIAAYSDDGTVFFVSGDALFRYDGDKTRMLTRPVFHDFAVEPGGERLVVARPDEEPDGRLELVDRDGRLLRRLDQGRGSSSLPIFSPDGGTLIFVSSATGVSAFWSVELDRDSSPVQLTNLDSKPGELGESFVPPPNSREGMRFVDGSTLVYDAGGSEFWELDIRTGETRHLEAPR